MKAFSFGWWKAAAPALVLVLAPLARAQPGPAPVPPNATLQIQVHVPSTWLILADDTIRGSIEDEVKNGLAQSGVGFPAETAGLIEDTSQSPWVLSITLTQWQLDAEGYAHCTFSATLKTPKATRALGPYTGSTAAWMSDGPPFTLSSTIIEAAREPVSRLCGDVAKSGLLPATGRPALSEPQQADPAA